MSNVPYSLPSLIGVQKLQKIQDNIASVMRVTVRTYDTNGKPLTEPSGLPRLCSELVPEWRSDFCGYCKPTFLGGKAVVDKNLSFYCVDGLSNYLIPIRLSSGLVLGYLIVGPVILVRRDSKEGYQGLADMLSMSLDAVWEAIQEIRVVSFQGVQAIVSLIEDIFNFTIHKSKLLAGSEPEESISDQELDRMLTVVLNLATEMSRSDISSIMLVDEDTKSLVMKASRGLGEEVAKKARSRIGEGVAGRVAQNGEPLLLDETVEDASLKPLLKRPAIRSSMVLPVRVNNRVMGVVNLAVLHTSAIRYTREDVGQLEKLLELASVALQ